MRLHSKELPRRRSRTDLVSTAILLQPIESETSCICDLGDMDQSSLQHNRFGRVRLPMREPEHDRGGIGYERESDRSDIPRFWEW